MWFLWSFKVWEVRKQQRLQARMKQALNSVDISCSEASVFKCVSQHYPPDRRHSYIYRLTPKQPFSPSFIPFFHTVIITFYAICAIEYFIRYSRDRPIRKPDNEWKSKFSPSTISATSDRGEFNGRLKLLCFALVFSTTCLWIRAVYRVIELADGWGGRIIKTQVRVFFIFLPPSPSPLFSYILTDIHHPDIFQRARCSDDHSSHVHRQLPPPRLAP